MCHIRSGDHFINTWLSLWIRSFLNLDIYHVSSGFSLTSHLSENNSLLNSLLEKEFWALNSLSLLLGVY